MRKLLLIRGPQGAGKSYWLQQSGLSSYSLSMDQLRLAHSGLVLDSQGKFSINNDPKFNQQIHTEFLSIAEARMNKGELLCIEGAAMMTADLKDWLARAQFHRYEVCLVDLSNMPVELIQQRNATRPAVIQSSANLVATTAERLQSSRKDIPAGLKVINWQPQDAQWQEAINWLAVPIRDLSQYQQIVHIGDLQGCHTVLCGPGGPLEHGLRDDTFYIFAGDLLDRGLENDKVFNFAIQEIISRPNTALLWGNHEDHLHRWSRNLPPVSHEFGTRTLPQLLQGGATPEQADKLMAFAVDCFPYVFQGQKVLVTHGGLSTVPNHLEYISHNQYSHGIGNWSDPIDETFESLAPGDWIQVHGHRNQNSLAVQATPRSFNLENSVEFGGTLRVATLSPQGWTTQEYGNRLFQPYRQRRLMQTETIVRPDWLDSPSDTLISETDWQQMLAHSEVKSKSGARYPHVISLNFSKKVFFDKLWDDVVVKARGLFINQQTREIVARSYDKFFNFSEPGIADTTPQALQNSLQYPVIGYRKENGYLGLIGYDAETDALFLSSKSSPDSDFSDWMQEILNHTMAPGKQAKLKRYLRDTESCMVVEVIDKTRDPHMIAYPSNQLVVLDVFARSSKVQKLPYHTLKILAKQFGLPCKEASVRFRNWNALSHWLDKVEHDLTYQVDHQFVEGFVLEDATGFQFKSKTAYYSFWKTMRGVKNRLESIHKKTGMSKQAQTNVQQSQRARCNHPLANAFLDWCLKQPPATLELDVIQLRQQFEATTIIDPAWLATRWSLTSPGAVSSPVSASSAVVQAPVVGLSSPVPTLLVPSPKPRV